MAINDIKSEAARAAIQRIMQVAESAGLHLHVHPPENLKKAGAQAIIQFKMAGDDAAFACAGETRTAFDLHGPDCTSLGGATVDYSGHDLIVVSMAPNATLVELFARAGVKLPAGATDGIDPKGNWFETEAAEGAEKAEIRKKFRAYMKDTLGLMERDRLILSAVRRMVKDAGRNALIDVAPVELFGPMIATAGMDPKVAPKHMPTDWDALIERVRRHQLAVTMDFMMVNQILLEAKKIAPLIEAEPLAVPPSVISIIEGRKG